MANELNGIQIDNLVFTGLVRLNLKTLQPQLAMAESITTKNNRNWTIKLKKGWTRS